MLFTVPIFDGFFRENYLKGRALQSVITMFNNDDIIVAGATGLHDERLTFYITQTDVNNNDF